jgi:hypothetical protein
MSILNWNYRGLEQSPTVQELTRLVRKFCPKVLFISETRHQSNIVSNLRHRLNLKKVFIVDGQGKGGGLGLFWDESINIRILSYGLHYIDTFISNADHLAHWRGTFVYGESHTHVRSDMWELLK